MIIISTISIVVTRELLSSYYLQYKIRLKLRSPILFFFSQFSMLWPFFLCNGYPLLISILECELKPRSHLEYQHHHSFNVAIFRLRFMFFCLVFLFFIAFVNISNSSSWSLSFSLDYILATATFIHGFRNFKE